MQIFISAPFFSKNQINKIKQVERALTDNPTVDSYYSPRLHQSGDGYQEWSQKWCHATYHHDLENAVGADAIVEILDYDKDDTDSGSAYEFGYAKAKGQFVTTILLDDYPQNLMIGVGSDYHFNNLNQLRCYDFNKKATNTYKGKLH